MSVGIIEQKKQHQTLSRDFPMRCRFSGTGRQETSWSHSKCVFLGRFK